MKVVPAQLDVLNQILVAACPQVSCHGCDMGTGLRAGKRCFPQHRAFAGSLWTFMHGGAPSFNPDS